MYNLKIDDYFLPPLWTDFFFYKYCVSIILLIFAFPLLCFWLISSLAETGPVPFEFSEGETYS
jgi:NADH:ubiquinone oxidoreductase subunit H